MRCADFATEQNVVITWQCTLLEIDYLFEFGRFRQYMSTEHAWTEFRIFRYVYSTIFMHALYIFEPGGATE